MASPLGFVYGVGSFEGIGLRSKALRWSEKQ
jgi:hypothetical protein